MIKKDNILVIGACGQIGRELLLALREKYGKQNVTAADIHSELKTGPDLSPYLQLDVMDKDILEYAFKYEQFSQVYHLAAMLSANGEKDPQAAWNLNMESLLSVLDLSVKYKVDKVFWPSSIAVFGPDSPKQDCPQDGLTASATVYGISKAAGEQWCNYYFQKYGLDVRSLRYPGLISYTGAPGGGTTDYAVDIFHHAVKGKPYKCFLSEDTALPMMYMHDAIRATLELMYAPAARLTIRTAYNLGALSFTPRELYQEIVRETGPFDIEYVSDFRQQIANSWPVSIDDEKARQDWGWRPGFDLQKMVKEMLMGLSQPA
jgi:nucleoside-diphosphate-sugar epimerase